MQQAINMGVNMMDTIMLGNLGEAQLSASSLANTFYSVFNTLCLGVIGGCSVLAAQYWGAENKEKCRETFSLAVRIIGVIAIAFGLVTYFAPRAVMRLYTDEEPVISAGIGYLKIMAFVYLIHGTAMVIAFLMRSVRAATLGLVVSIVSFVVNVVSNYALIFGKFGAPRLEIVGASLGTLIARISEFLVTFGYIFFIDRRLELKPRDFIKNPPRDLFVTYLKVGMPALISDGLIGVGASIMSTVLGHMGAAVVSAQAVCQVVNRLFTVIVVGMASAAGVLTGNAIGRGDREQAADQAETFYWLGLVFGVLSAVMFFVFGNLSLSFYRLEDATIGITRVLIRAHAFIIVFQCIQSIMTKGVLRGGGDTRFLMVADILFLWVLSLPLGALGAFVFKWPAWAVVICLRADYIVKTFWCYRRMKSGKWMKRHAVNTSKA